MRAFYSEEGWVWGGFVPPIVENPEKFRIPKFFVWHRTFGTGLSRLPCQAFRLAGLAPRSK
jgi:hypothetical protein